MTTTSGPFAGCGYNSLLTTRLPATSQIIPVDSFKLNDTICPFELVLQRRYTIINFDSNA